MASLSEIMGKANAKDDENGERSILLAEIKRDPNRVLAYRPEQGLVSWKEAKREYGLHFKDLRKIHHTAYCAMSRGQTGVYFPLKDIAALFEDVSAQRIVPVNAIPESQILRCTPRRAHCTIKELRHLATFGQQRGRRGKAAYFYPKEEVEARWPECLLPLAEGCRRSNRSANTAQQEHVGMADLLHKEN